MYQNLKNFYEKFHRETTDQKKVISSKNFTYRLILAVLDPYLKRKKRVLDIGCGAGTLTFYLARKGNWVMGVDLSSRAIKACRQSAKFLELEENTKFKVGNFPEVSIRRKFDLVLCTEVLEHLLDEKRALNAIFELLRPGGFAIISVPSKNAPLYRLGMAREFDRRVGHLRRYSQKRLNRIVSESGFKIQKIEKTESLVRNFLFLNTMVGKLVGLLNRVEFLSDLITFLDQLAIPLFGESNILIVAQKP